MKNFMPGQIVKLVVAPLDKERATGIIASYFDMWGWLAHPYLHVGSIVILVERSDHPSNVCMFKVLSELGIRFISTKNLADLEESRGCDGKV